MDPINPPEGVPVGERITFEGYDNEPDAQLNPKKNVFGKLAPDLLTNAGKLLSTTFLFSSLRPCVGTTVQGVRGGLDCSSQHCLIQSTTMQDFLFFTAMSCTSKLFFEQVESCGACVEFAHTVTGQCVGR